MRTTAPESGGGGGNSRLTFKAAAGRRYRIEVRGSSDEWGGPFEVAAVRGAPPTLDVPHAELFLRKGFRSAIDSYSALRENDRRTPTGLAGYLRERGLERITVCGLATDFCVAFSAIDGRDAGFEVTVVTGACRGIDLDGSLARAMRSMSEAGVSVRAA